MRVLLLSYLFITCVLLSIVFHEAAHVIIDFEYNPQRACVPIMEQNNLGAVAYVEFVPGIDRKGFSGNEFWPFMSSLIPVLFIVYLVIREDIL